MTPTPVTREKIARCRAELAARRRHLVFAQPLEGEFRHHLQAAHFRSVCWLLLIGLLIWIGFASLDFVRYPSADQPALQHAYWRHIFLPRWFVLGLGLVCAGLLLAKRLTAHSPALLWWKFGFLYLIGTISFTTGNFFAANDIVTARNSNVILVMICFFPLGLVMRQGLWLAVALCTTNMLVGYVMLPQPLLTEHWMLSVIVWATLVVSAVSGALREKATRDQFLLRILLEWEAQHDPLTGMTNRRYFEEWARISLRQARREGQPLAMAIVDIDYFKRYNDNYGHQQGDDALQQVAACLHQYANRPLDLAVRLGGEEFAIIGYGETAQSLQQRLRKFQQELTATGIAHAFSPAAKVMTASIGVTEFNTAETLESLYQRADRALYQAKADGRNRVVTLDSDA